MSFDFSLISALSIFAPLLVGAFLVKRLYYNYRLTFYWVIVSFLIEFGARILYEQKINNMVFNHLQTSLEFVFLAVIYYRLFRTKYFQRMVLVVSAIFTVVSITNLVVYEGFNEFNSVQRYTEVLLLVLIGLVYLVELASRFKSHEIKKNPFFWFTVGYVIYFCGTILLFVNQKHFLKAGEYHYWIVHGIFNIFLNSMLTFVLWKGSQRSLFVGTILLVAFAVVIILVALKASSNKEEES